MLRLTLKEVSNIKKKHQAYERPVGSKLAASKYLCSCRASLNTAKNSLVYRFCFAFIEKLLVERNMSDFLIEGIGNALRKRVETFE